MKTTWSIALSLSLIVIFCWGAFEHTVENSFEAAKVSKALNLTGTPPRLEREFKIGIHTLSKKRSDNLFSVVSEILENHWLIDNGDAGKQLGQHYFFKDTIKTFLFRDIYFDTATNELEKKSVVYRLRYRWDLLASFYRYIQGNRESVHRPVRIEIQTKQKRNLLALGYYEALETRFELMPHNPPIVTLFDSSQHDAILPAMIRLAKTGIYGDQMIYPLWALSREFIDTENANRSVYLSPKQIVITERTRIHINMRTPWGIGGNPDNVFLVTIDKFWGFPVKRSARTERDFFKDLMVHQKMSPPHKYEIEIEFERNASTRLDEMIAQAREKNDKATELKWTLTREAFLKDHKKLNAVLFSKLQEEGFDVYPEEMSKSSRVFDTSSLTEKNQTDQ